MLNNKKVCFISLYTQYCWVFWLLVEQKYAVQQHFGGLVDFVMLWKTSKWGLSIIQERIIEWIPVMMLTLRAWPGFRKTEAYLSAGGTETVLICPDSMPAEAADLVSTGAGEKVDVIDLQWFHTQRALHRVVLHLGAPGHPTIPHCWTSLLSQDRDRRSCTHCNKGQPQL